jgi:hypothetical protein
VLILATLALFAEARSEATDAQWVINPSVPGADMPHAGASLFDRLTIGEDGKQEVPFPFERLIARLEAAAGCNASQPCTRAVLIPLGRSLQRVAASPAFFRHPRVVAAVVGEGSGLLLRDRLYLGFQDKSGTLEVISYNQALGRFEFQIVRNFSPDAAPEVVYARRTVCISCHQNQGPIFSQPVWLETNANAQVAARLAEQQASFHGVTARGNADIAQAIDDATDRANTFALTQRLWMEGCGAGQRGDACRRSVVAASLQFALTGQRSYARSEGGFARNVVRAMDANAAKQWPAGLALPGSDIPNRDPLDLHAGVTALLAANVDTRFDPLSPRPPAEIVTASFDDRLVRGVAGFWSERSRNALASALDRRNDSARHRTRLPCRVSGDPGLEQFDCASPSGRLRGSLNNATGTIEEIAVDGDEPVRHLRIESVNRQSFAAALRVRTHGHRARLGNGDAVDRIDLSWRLNRTDDANGEALIEVRKEFTALADVLAQTEIPSGPLDSSLIDAVTARLNGASASPATKLEPVASADRYMPAAAQSDPVAMQFETQCGTCHHTAENTPPNFLSGDAQRVKESLRSCGPRIFARLAMRHLPAGQRVKSPMPPESPSVSARMQEQQPADERALIELQTTVGAALRREYGRDIGIDELLRRGYESLRPCLPPIVAGEAGYGRTGS